MPRRSSAELSLGPLRTGHARLEAPANLAGPEKALFEQVVASVPDGFFAQEDQMLLAAYARALHQNEIAGRALAGGSTDPHMIALATASVRSITQLATRLRLGPKGRVPSHRRRQGNAMRPQGSVKPWNDHVLDDGDDKEHRIGDLQAIEQGDTASAIGAGRVGNDASPVPPVDNPATPMVESGSARKPTRDELIEASKKYSGARNGGDNFPAPDSTAPR